MQRQRKMTLQKRQGELTKSGANGRMRRMSTNMLKTGESSIIEIRGVPVILDCDIATFYGVETKHVNQAVSNNPDKGCIKILLRDWEI